MKGDINTMMIVYSRLFYALLIAAAVILFAKQNGLYLDPLRNPQHKTAPGNINILLLSLVIYALVTATDSNSAKEITEKISIEVAAMLVAGFINKIFHI